jgi:hypothetical protein
MYFLVASPFTPLRGAALAPPPFFFLSVVHLSSLPRAAGPTVFFFEPVLMILVTISEIF